jgi:hypothetical protein
MKKSTRKLRLHRETLLSLNDPNLQVAVGGASAGTGCCGDPTLAGTNCTSCNWTDTCTNCSNRCQ